LCAGLAGPALAGDRALLDYIGFSQDSRYFAFEEFGIQDGSGFAYSTIYVVDLAEDAWVTGTPIRVRHEDETATLAQVRAESADQLAPILADLDITAPVEVLAQNGDGDHEASFGQLRFGVPGYGRDATRSDYRLSLAERIAQSPLPCADWFSQPPMGLLLTLDEIGGESRIVHHDERVPRSRGCAQEYRLYSVVQPGWAQSVDSAVAIVSVYPGGFEGPDRRFLAVPLGN
jgi:predicted secreted protein